MMTTRPTYPATYPVAPRGAIVAEVTPPGSKSITNRALVVAALANGVSRVVGPLLSDDTEAMRDCLRGLGVAIDLDGADLVVDGPPVLSPVVEVVDARGSGTTARFVTAAATLADGPVIIDGNPRMRERPIADLVDALVRLGGRVTVAGASGCPPVEVAGGGLAGGRAAIDASRSSQYVSAVMMAAPLARNPVWLRLAGPVVSRPYIQSTLDVMRAFGVEARWSEDDVIAIPTGRYHPREYRVEPDASAAVYAWAAAAVSGGSVTVRGIAPATSQADIGVLEVFTEMGCDVEVEGTAITVRGPRLLRGVEVDMNRCPDAVLAAAVVASFGEGPTTIRNVGNLRIKETDRLAALQSELRRMGHGAVAGPDWLRIEPRRPQGAHIRTYDDHRMAMAFAIAGLVVPGVVIDDPACVAKTWPGFFAALEEW